jgi:hypothetical protein
MFTIRLRYLLVTLLLAGCAPRNGGPPIGEGFVAPATLNLRQELGAQQPSVATVKRGERLEILARRRSFVKVRAKSGAVGWVDGRLLFSPEQTEELRALGRWAASLPSQGQATVLDVLNVHTHPDRQAPGFHQIREGDRVAVVAHRLVSSPARTDDWTLVRISETEAGWVLTRNLVMAIPDEVAQYAEGRRITSYFSLGEVRDGDQVKHNWLWTTIAKGAVPYQFDSVRVFVWSLRRHRYETAHIERNLKGYYPVEVQNAARSTPGFSLVVEEKDGARFRRTYAFQGQRVRLVSKAPAAPAADGPAAPKTADKPRPGESAPSQSFLARVWRRLFGR